MGAWYAARAIAEPVGGSLLGLPLDTVITSVRCQTEAPVDDVLIETGSGGFLFIQCKRKLQLGATPSGAFASALNQFVLQWIVCEQRSESYRWTRPLDTERDRLVLVTSRESSAPVTSVMSRVLQRLRDAGIGPTLEEVADSQEEHRVATQVVAMTRRAFIARLNREPNDRELGAILRLIWIQVLDLEDGEVDAAASLQLLSHSVVATAQNAANAWNVLWKLTSRLAAQRSGATATTLRAELRNANVPLRSPPSYQDDIQALQTWTRQKVGQGAIFTRLKLDDPDSAIQRDVFSSLLEAAGDMSFLVTGEPGSGKSGVIYELAQSLQTAGHDVVFLPVDRLSVSGRAELMGELRIQRDLINVLENWEGTTSGYVIIDALDAARNFSTQSAFRDLVASLMALGSRWRVVASVRKYDLRFGLEWRQLFAGKAPAPSFRDAEFSDVRHIAIPRLSNHEIEAVTAKQPALKAYLSTAPTELWDLLRTVFNLHLLMQLLDVGATSHALAQIRTQLDLLDRWWVHRVYGSDRKHDARERALSILLECMIGARSLQVTRAALRALRELDLDMLADLEAQGVLRATDTAEAMAGADRVQFAHHILFDYAVARLPFARGSDPALLVDRLSRDRDLALVLRPSLNLVCLDTWSFARPRTSFWALCLALAGSDKIAEVAKLAAPMIVAEYAHHLSDLEPLLKRLPTREGEHLDESARVVLAHLLGALLVLAAGGKALTGADNLPWAAFAAALAERAHRSIMFNLRTLVWKICESAQQWTDDQRRDVGKAARRLLAYAWSPGAYDANLVTNAVDGVLKTFDTNVAASKALLAQALAPDHMREHAYSEMHWIARGILQIAAADPNFAADIYAAAFGFRENSDAKTSMGESQILPLSSNRRQDFEMSWFQLSEAFPNFIEGHPEEGIRALARATEGHLTRAREHTGETANFIFHGIPAQIMVDHSYTWRQFKHYSDALTLLPAFDNWLDSLAEQPEPERAFAEALMFVAKHNRLAGIWTAVIAAAERHPQAFGGTVAGLLALPEILSSLETTHEIGLCLPAIYPYISMEARTAIETTVLGLEGVRGERSRNILLGAIPEELFATAAGRAARDTAKAEEKLLPNRRPIEFTSSSGVYDSKAYLRDEGVDVDSGEATRLLSLEDNLKAFSSEHLNKAPTPADIIKVWPAVQAIWDEFKVQENTGEPRLVDHALSVTAEAAVRIARADLSAPELADIRVRIVEILLRSADGKFPEVHENIEEQFNTSVSWGSPSARIEAAQGIVALLRRHYDPALLPIVERLLHDPVAAVRWHIAHNLFVFAKDNSEFVWASAERLKKTEDNRGVIAGFLGETLPRLFILDKTRTIDYAASMLARFEGDARPGVDRCVEFILSLLWDLYIWYDDARSTQLVFAHLDSSPQYTDQLRTLLARQRGTLTAGAIDNPQDAAHGARERTFAIYEIVARTAFSRVSQLLEKHKGENFNDWPEAEQNLARENFGLLDHITRELYFASGAYSGNTYPKAPTKPPDAAQERFYRRSTALFDLLSQVLVAPVAHHLIETLEFFISTDPAGVFRLVARSIRTAEAGGYTLEHMGSGLFVRIVERYLADHRDVFADKALRDDLLDSLDAFVRAGWPDARALTFKIADIWR